MKPSFLADAMLGGVARKLRIFGFDTLYITNIDDQDILKIGTAHDRIILTCDKELFRRVIKARLEGVLLRGCNDIEDIAHILYKYGVRSVSVSTAKSRCTGCNGLLEMKKPSEINENVPANIRKRQKKFFECRNCTKIYWEGSHFLRIRLLAIKIEMKIKQQLKNPISD